MPSACDHQSRETRIQARTRWDRAFSRRYSEALAKTLVDVLSDLEDPTIGDLLSHVGEGEYDLDDHFAVEVPIGEFVGRPGDGPTVRDVVEAIEILGPDVLDVAIASRLASLLE